RRNRPIVTGGGGASTGAAVSDSVAVNPRTASARPAATPAINQIDAYAAHADHTSSGCDASDASETRAVRDAAYAPVAARRWPISVSAPAIAARDIDAAKPRGTAATSQAMWWPFATATASQATAATRHASIK